MSIKSLDISPDVISDLIQVHKNAYLDDHFTNKLSDKLLKEYYLQLVSSDSRFSFILYESDTPVGFIICGCDLNSNVKAFIRANFLSIFGVLIFNPKFLLPKIKAFFTRFSKTSWKSKANTRLLSIAVNNSIQGKGYGKKLLIELETRLKGGNHTRYGLSVKNGNKGAISFYLNNGFKKERSDAKSSYFLKEIK